MSMLSSELPATGISCISPEDLYNYLYWDHRIYDLRSKEDYTTGHILRAHHMNPLPTATVDRILQIDAQIDDEYGRAEQPSKVIIYTYDDTHRDYQLQLELINLLISYLVSPINPSNRLLKHIYTLTGGYKHFHSIFPFLCSDSIHYDECSQLVCPSYIVPNLYLGSASCRDETLISMLGITHIMSFSDYPEKKLTSVHVKTLHWQISDSLSATLLPIFPIAVAWISKAIDNEKGTVLVHCEQGVSRSSSVIIAYLLNTNEKFLTVNAALEHVRSKRSVIRPNSSFLQQLEDYCTTIATKKQNLNLEKQSFTDSKTYTS